MENNIFKWISWKSIKEYYEFDIMHFFSLVKILDTNENRRLSLRSLKFSKLLWIESFRKLKYLRNHRTCFFFQQHAGIPKCFKTYETFECSFPFENGYNAWPYFCRLQRWRKKDLCGVSICVTSVAKNKNSTETSKNEKYESFSSIGT